MTDLERGRRRPPENAVRRSPAEPAEAGEPPSDLAEYLGIFARQWRVIVAVVVLCVFAAFGYSSLQTKIYESTADVLVQPVNLSPTQAPASTIINGDAEVRIATSAAVKALAANRMGSRHPTADVAVSSPANSNTLIFVASSSSPSGAQKAAQAYADSYLRARHDTILQLVLAARAPLAAELNAVTGNITSVSASLAGVTSPSQQALLNTQLTSLTARQSSLYQQLDAIIQPQGVNPGAVITPAVIPTAPARPNTKKTLLLALFAGLGLAVGVATARDRLDRRSRRTTDIARGIRAPVLTTVPWVALLGQMTDRLDMLDGDSEFTRAFRTLRATIKPAVANGVKSVLVTSPTRGDGKTTTVANLGRVLSRAGEVVVLVSADLKHPDLGEYFDVHPKFGLTSVMNGERSATEALAAAGDGLHLLDVGPKPETATELLGSAPMAHLLASLEAFADIVLIDAPAVLDRPDVLALAPLADATLLVVDVRRATPSDVNETRQLLESVGANVVGAVLNNADAKLFRSNGSGHHNGRAASTATNATWPPSPTPPEWSA